MKKTLLLLACFFFAYFALIAQDEGYDSAPASVEKAFKKKFPNAKAPSWEMDFDGNWIAGFDMAGKAVSGTFTGDGNWIQTSTSVKPADLPQAVNVALSKKFQKYTVISAVFVESTEGKWYEMEVDKAGDIYEMLIDPKGNIMAHEEDEADFEDEEYEDDFEDE